MQTVEVAVAVQIAVQQADAEAAEVLLLLQLFRVREGRRIEFDLRDILILAAVVAFVLITTRRDEQVTREPIPQEGTAAGTGSEH